MKLETERLILREMTMKDFDALYAVLADADIMRHYPYAFDEARVRSWIQRNMNRYRKDGFGLLAVCLKRTGEMIGDCGLTLQDIEGETLPEIGYHIRRDCQRKGYAREAARAVRDWAFTHTDFPAVYSYCKYTNEPSFKTAEAIGMRFLKEYPDAANGFTRVSGMTREEWIAQMEKKPGEIAATRLRLAPLLPEDREALLSLLLDEEISRTYMVPDLSTEEKKNALFERLLALSHTDGRFVYGMYLRDRLIGLIHDVGIRGEEIEVGYCVSPAEKNKGYASEALAALLPVLFSQGFSVVRAGAFAENAASLRVMEKCGLERTGETESVDYRGESHLCVYCAVGKNRMGREARPGGN